MSVTPGTRIYVVVRQSIWTNHGDDDGFGGTVQGAFLCRREALQTAIRGNLLLWNEIIHTKATAPVPVNQWGYVERTYRTKLSGWVYEFVCKSLRKKRFDIESFMKRELTMDKMEQLHDYLIASSHERSIRPELFKDFHYFDVQDVPLTTNTL